MSFIQAIVVKFIMIVAFVALTLPETGAVSLSNAIIISLAATVLTFVIGDLLILPRTNSSIAAVADVPMLFIIFYGAQYVIPGIVVTVFGALLTSAIISFIEWLIHHYFKRTILREG
ncbi:MAG: DUF2512 family protein [Bacillota bacterium]|nr:DUF2512 family protein [Bacillota bacterium]